VASAHTDVRVRAQASGQPPLPEIEARFSKLVLAARAPHGRCRPVLTHSAALR
jgi:hypothetical protein